MCLWNLHYSLELITLFNYYIFVTCWNLACFLVLIKKLIPLIWEIQNQNSADRDFEAAKFKNQVLSIVFLTLALIYSLDFLYLLHILILHSFFVPQILENAINGFRYSINLGSVYLIGISRCLLLLYVLGCPANAFAFETHLLYAILISAYILLQCTILSIQRSPLGPRFMVPSRWRPKVYIYYRSLHEEEFMDEDICAICMNPLNLQHTSEVTTTHRVMHTPCEHKFHETCLTCWMNIKLECPTCRFHLPTLEE